MRQFRNGLTWHTQPDDGSLAFQRGISNLERLLKARHPDVTALLPNYPNPFNPETWIPYHLAHACRCNAHHLRHNRRHGASIASRVSSLRATTQIRTQAGYWDGRNNLGETVGSGIYFYHLQAGDFSATRKLVIIK